MNTTGVFPLAFAWSICCCSCSVVAMSMPPGVMRAVSTPALAECGDDIAAVFDDRAAVRGCSQRPGHVSRERTHAPPDEQVVAAAFEVPPVQAGVALGGGLVAQVPQDHEPARANDLEHVANPAARVQAVIERVLRVG